jgi:hypothetical protein
MVENDALGQLKPVPATLTYQYLVWNGLSHIGETESNVRKGHDECSQIQGDNRYHYPIVSSRQLTVSQCPSSGKNQTHLEHLD